MESSLHAHHLDAIQKSENHFSGMTLHRRDREVWNFLIREAVGFRQQISQMTQPWSANDSDLGAEFSFGQKIVCNFANRLVRVAVPMIRQV